MSSKEQIMTLLDTMPEYKIEYILSVVKVVSALDENEDDLFCKKLVEDYLNNNELQKHETVTIEELAKELDITLSHTK